MRTSMVLVSVAAVLAACSGGSESSQPLEGEPSTMSGEGSTVSTGVAGGEPAATAGPPVARPWEGAPGAATCDDGFSPTLVGLDPTTGAPRWVHCPAEPSSYTIIGLEGDVVHAVAPRSTGGQEPQLDYLAVDAGDGSLLWRKVVTHRFSGEPMGLATGAPGPVGGGDVTVLLIGDAATGTIVALESPSGEELWSMPADGMLTLAHGDDVVVLASQGRPSPSGTPLAQRVQALDRRTGEERWATEVVGLNWPYAVAGGVLVVDMAGDTVGIDLADGQELWRTRNGLDGARSVGVATSIVSEGSQRGRRGVVAHDPSTGEQRWVVSGIPFNSMWAYDDEAVYLHDLESGQIMAVSADDGTERWRIDDLGEVYAAGDGRVLVAGGDLPGHGDMNGLSAADGAVAWTTPLPLVEPAYATSAAVDEDLAVVAISGLAPRD